MKRVIRLRIFKNRQAFIILTSQFPRFESKDSNLKIFGPGNGRSMYLIQDVHGFIRRTLGRVDADDGTGLIRHGDFWLNRACRRDPTTRARTKRHGDHIDHIKGHNVVKLDTLVRGCTAET
ncbi:hypothetical protein PsorP6_012077 [Peronosclerospora sorghi]|uniref:Uncharacterized protein n=1 Tax=Peronosclerospora sorghi TaxID=230839 RepID=A0ACC0WJK8_9STRA|nr:hypothetical protein PsorP6_012077 [Peronosclerospora sorghi]